MDILCGQPFNGRSDQILYILPKPDPAGRTALRLSALEFLDRLATILPPPRIHRHRYHGVFAPNAPLRPLVTARAQEDNARAVQVPRSDPELPLRSPAPSPRPESPPPQSPNSTPSRLSKWVALLASGHRREALVARCFPSSAPPARNPSRSSRS